MFSAGLRTRLERLNKKLFSLVLQLYLFLKLIQVSFLFFYGLLKKLFCFSQHKSNITTFSFVSIVNISSVYASYIHMYLFITMYVHRTCVPPNKNNFRYQNFQVQKSILLWTVVACKVLLIANLIKVFIHMCICVVFMAQKEKQQQSRYIHI